MRVPGKSLLLFATFLAGCTGDTGVAPEVRPLASPTLASRVVQAVHGSGHITQAGELRTFTFSAERRADGSVSGEFQIIARTVDRVAHGRITCMTVFGNAAWLGGVVERDDSGVSTGAEARFRVVDLAQMPGSSQDLMSLLSFLFVPGAAQAYCNTAPSFPALLPAEKGEITVTQPGSSSFTTSAIVPLSFPILIPCAMGGAGEVVLLSGNLHMLSHFTEDGAGGFHAMNESNPQGISGVGESSGDKYQGTGVTRFGFNARGLPMTQTFVNNFRIIGEGTDNNFTVHHNVHMTVNANGQLTATVDNFRGDCQ
jgi:hypothetical protein